MAMIFELPLLISNAIYDLDKNIIMLAITNSLSAHVDNSKKDILILVKVQHMN